MAHIIFIGRQQVKTLLFMIILTSIFSNANDFEVHTSLIDIALGRSHF